MKLAVDVEEICVGNPDLNGEMSSWLEPTLTVYGMVKCAWIQNMIAFPCQSPCQFRF